MRWSLTTVVLATALLAPRGADACCSFGNEPSPADAARHADAVFKGRVVAFEDFGDARLEVLDVWKGDPGDEIVVNSEHDDSCDGWAFPGDVGGEVIVYLHDDSQGRWINHTAVGDDIAEHESVLGPRYAGCEVSPETGSSGVAMLLCVVVLRRRRSPC